MLRPDSSVVVCRFTSNSTILQNRTSSSTCLACLAWQYVIAMPAVTTASLRLANVVNSQERALLLISSREQQRVATNLPSPCVSLQTFPCAFIDVQEVLRGRQKLQHCPTLRMLSGEVIKLKADCGESITTLLPEEWGSGNIRS